MPYPDSPIVDSDTRTLRGYALSESQKNRLSSIGAEIYNTSRTEVRSADPQPGAAVKDLLEEYEDLRYFASGRGRVVCELTESLQPAEHDWYTNAEVTGFVVKFPLTVKDSEPLIDGRQQIATERRYVRSPPPPIQEFLCPIVDVDPANNWIVFPDVTEMLDRGKVNEIGEIFNAHGYTSEDITREANLGSFMGFPVLIDYGMPLSKDERLFAANWFDNQSPHHA